MRMLISDLHLEDDIPERTEALSSLLNEHKVKLDELYILGDFFNYWVGDDHQTECSRRVASITSKLPWVGWIYGNRDYLIGEDYCNQAGMTPLKEPYPIKLANIPTILCHGDMLCTDDIEHQKAREKFTNKEFRNMLLSKTLEKRLELARSYREYSTRRKKNLETSFIMDVNNNAVEQILQNNKAKLLIHGHTHRPALHDHNNGQRLVLGDWGKHGWYIAERDSKIELIRFPIPYNPKQEECVATIS